MGRVRVEVRKYNADKDQLISTRVIDEGEFRVTGDDHQAGLFRAARDARELVLGTLAEAGRELPADVDRTIELCVIVDGLPPGATFFGDFFVRMFASGKRILNARRSHVRSVGAVRVCFKNSANSFEVVVHASRPIASHNLIDVLERVLKHAP
jgi:hypothetical protein